MSRLEVKLFIDLNSGWGCGGGGGLKREEFRGFTLLIVKLL